MRHLAQARNPYSRSWLWIPGSLVLLAPRNDGDCCLQGKPHMDAREIIKVGMSAERTLVVPPERTVGHFVPGMPMVYATPMMILEMEMASGDAIRGHLQPGWVTVGTEVD